MTSTREVNCNEQVSAVIDVPCPRCGMPQGIACIDVRLGQQNLYYRERDGFHSERLKLFGRIGQQGQASPRGQNSMASTPKSLSSAVELPIACPCDFRPYPHIITDPEERNLHNWGGKSRWPNIRTVGERKAR